MSHVDEGTLHAYLDGELTPVERERVDVHLAGCPACQARLAEERAILERASRLLGMASPPERAMPPLSQLRERRLPWWQVRRPLAWAATLILAVGLGWYARGIVQDLPTPVHESADLATRQGSTDVARLPAAPVMDNEPLAGRPQGRLSMRAPRHTFDSGAKDRDERQLAAIGTTGAVNALQPRDSSPAAAGAPAHQKTDALAQLPSTIPPTVTAREGRAAAAEPQANLYVDGTLARRRVPALTTSWPLISREPAREVLGVEPAVIPGFTVRAYRRNPASLEIAVEQVTDAGTTISLIERRVDNANAEGYRADGPAASMPRAMAKAVNERLARFLGPLRIEIEGPLTPDSLSNLLELAR